MTYTLPTEAGKEVSRAIDAELRLIEQLQAEVTERNQRIEWLTGLLRYCKCMKCGADLEGGIHNAQNMQAAAKLAGREDVPCVFCDTPEQAAAIEAALERLDR